jgi:hypothetical protein
MQVRSPRRQVSSEIVVQTHHRSGGDRVVGWLDPDAYAGQVLGVEHWQLRTRIHNIKGAHGLKGADSVKVWYDAIDPARNGDVKCEKTGDYIGNVYDEH